MGIKISVRNGGRAEIHILKTMKSEHDAMKSSGPPLFPWPNTIEESFCNVHL
nr:hypothetical protein [uncultured Desulfobulbus sp.]